MVVQDTVVTAPADVVARRILREMFPPANEPNPEERRTFPLAEFQEAGLQRARRILRRRGGVIIADEVGLGKTFMALALLEETLERGGDGGVIAPAPLRPMWERHLNRLRGEKERHGAVHVAGGDTARGRVLVTTQTRLGRGTHPRSALGAADLLVVDEAHAFRNPRTHRYTALADLGRTARLVLLTATPVNNHPSDLVHLVRLFANDQGFADVGVTSLTGLLGTRGGRGQAGEVGLSSGVRRVAREVMVRRSRQVALEGPTAQTPSADASGAVRVGGTRLSFPRREAPELVRYEDPHLVDAVSLIGALELAPYRTQGDARALHDPGGADALLRLGLLKRLDSSRSAFVGSVRRLQSLLNRFEDAARAGLLMRPADQRADAVAAPADDDAVQLVMDALVLEAAPPEVDLAALAESARRDRRRLGDWAGRSGSGDPKRDALLRFVRGGGDARLLVFTEFRDTARTLWRALVPLGGVGRIDGEGAWLGSRRSSRGAVVRRFAPAANGAAEPAHRERVRILVATDVLGEGQNLQDAGVVVSYDLPWNPVRLLQRIGRVDRLGSPHDRVRTVLFVPTSGVDEMLGLTARLRTKLDGIVRTVGAEQAESLLRRLASGASGDMPAVGAMPGAAPVPALDGTSFDDPWERLRGLLAREAEPVHAVVGNDEGNRSPAGDHEAVLAGFLGPAGLQDGPEPHVRGWLVLVRAGAHPWLVAVDPDGTSRLADQDAARWLTLAFHERGGCRDMTLQRPSLTRAILAARAFVEAELATAAAPPPLRRRSAASRLGAIVRRVATQACTDGDPTLVGTADRLLEGLSRPTAAAMEPRIMTLLEWSRSAAARRLGPGEYLERIAEAIEPGVGVEPGGEPGGEVRVVAVLAVGSEAVDAGGRRV